MISRFDLDERVREWLLRDDIVEKDYHTDELMTKATTVFHGFTGTLAKFIKVMRHSGRAGGTYAGIRRYSVLLG